MFPWKLKLDTAGQLLWLLCLPAEREPILTSQTYCLFPRMNRECGNSAGHIVFIRVSVVGVRGRTWAVSPSFASPWERMPSELITCLEGPIKTPSNAP